MCFFLTALNACQDTLLAFFTEQPSVFWTMVLWVLELLQKQLLGTLTVVAESSGFSLHSVPLIAVISGNSCQEPQCRNHAEQMQNKRITRDRGDLLSDGMRKFNSPTYPNVRLLSRDCRATNWVTLVCWKSAWFLTIGVFFGVMDFNFVREIKLLREMYKHIAHHIDF